MLLFKCSSSLFLLAALVPSVVYAAKTCNVLNYGGVADGVTDVAPAIIKAHADCVAHATTQNPTDTILVVPAGQYALNSSVKFDNVNYFTMQIDGELDLVFNPALAGSMFAFSNCNHVVWSGNGSIHGHGDEWRPNGDLNKYPARPRLLRFQSCNNVDISGVTLYNSPMFHVTIIGDNNVAHDMKIVADHIGETDGFDVSGTNNHVHDVSVENGDECVTVKAPTNGFLAENIQCFYSGGCNVGSFGEHATDVSVQNVLYRHVTQYRGSGGIVLKSYPSVSGVVRNLTYLDFNFTGLAYPIKIDNDWCGNRECSSGNGTLSWQDITFKQISGTGDSTSRPIVDLNCAAGKTCSNIVFEDVAIVKENNVEAKVLISNACGSGLSNLPDC